MSTDLASFLPGYTPVGGIVAVSSGFTPTSNYKLADGSDVASASYPVLAAALPPAISSAIKTIPAENNISGMQGIAFGNGLYIGIVAGNSATGSSLYFDPIFTSTDGVTWLPKRMNGLNMESNTHFFTAISFLNGKFYLAVHNRTGVYNAIYTSANGADWVQIMADYTKAYYYYDNGTGAAGFDEAHINSIVYLNGTYIATNYVTNNYWSTFQNYYTSTDGVTWVVNNNAPSKYLTSIAFGAGVYVVVDSSNATWSSTNLTAWTSRTNTPTGGGGWTKVLFANSCFVSLQGYTSAGTSFGYSTDGITWSQKTVPSGRYWDVSFNASLFVATGYNVCVTSPDGITWTSRTVPTGQWQYLTYGAVGGFAAVNSATNGNIALNSSAGTTWTAVTLNTPSAFYNDVCYGTGLGYMAVSSSGIPSISADGITWTQKTTLSGLGSVAANPSGSIYVGMYIGNGGTGGTMYSTTDGVTWTSRFALSNNVSVRVRWCNDRFIALGYNQSQPAGGRIHWSTDGIKWTWADTATTSADNANQNYGLNFADVAYGNGVYVVVGSGAYVQQPTFVGETKNSVYSVDGGSWNLAQTMPAKAIWTGVAFGNGVFVAVSRQVRNRVGTGYTNIYNATYGNFNGFNAEGETTGRYGREAAVSVNGIDWFSSLLPFSAEWSGITFNGHVFIAVAQYSGSYAVSKDGYNWVVRQLPGQMFLGPICTGASNVALAVSAGNGTSVNLNSGAARFTESATQVTLPYIRPAEGVNYAVKVL